MRDARDRRRPGGGGRRVAAGEGGVADRDEEEAVREEGVRPVAEVQGGGR